jgi:hypothetical protein
MMRSCWYKSWQKSSTPESGSAVRLVVPASGAWWASSVTCSAARSLSRWERVMALVTYYLLHILELPFFWLQGTSISLVVSLWISVKSSMYITSSVMLRWKSEYMQFQVTVVTNCQSLTPCIIISYVQWNMDLMFMKEPFKMNLDSRKSQHNNSLFDVLPHTCFVIW